MEVHHFLGGTTLNHVLIFLFLLPKYLDSRYNQIWCYCSTGVKHVDCIIAIMSDLIGLVADLSLTEGGLVQDTLGPIL